MGFFDNASSLLNKGVANAGRGTKAISLKAQIADLGRSRSALMSQLGESLYEETRSNASFRAGRETIYASIENLDAQRAALQQELAAIEQQMHAEAIAQAAASAASPVVAGDRSCQVCGTQLGASDQFCCNCGTHYEPPAVQGRVCVACGKTLGPDDAFCMNCGTPVGAEPTVEPMDGIVTEEAAEPVLLASKEEEVKTIPDSAEEDFAVIEGGGIDDAVPAASPSLNVLVCPACGYHASVQAAFCRNCGKRL